MKKRQRSTATLQHRTPCCPGPLLSEPQLNQMTPFVKPETLQFQSIIIHQQPLCFYLTGTAELKNRHIPWEHIGFSSLNWESFKMLFRRSSSLNQFCLLKMAVRITTSLEMTAVPCDQPRFIFNSPLCSRLKIASSKG